MKQQPIGIFDSGFGGLTVLREIIKTLPQNDFLYLGDNARSPYGTRSFESIYQYTLQCVQYLFEQQCPLVVLACNTASARALRSIQQTDLPKKYPQKRVLGIIIPTAQTIGHYTKTKQIGILATSGTVASQSYPIEITKFFPELNVYQQACPMWVPMVENGELDNAGTDFFIQKYLNQLFAQCQTIDTVLLACTHYPLLIEGIKKHLPKGVQVLSQGKIVADSLADYLIRHPEIARECTKSKQINFLTTDDTVSFDEKGTLFFGKTIASNHLNWSLV